MSETFDKLIEGIEPAEIYSRAEDALFRLAQSGMVAPILFVVASNMVPGVDKEAAVHLNKQWYNNKGFPTRTEERGKLYGGNSRLDGKTTDV